MATTEPEVPLPDDIEPEAPEIEEPEPDVPLPDEIEPEVPEEVPEPDVPLPDEIETQAPEANPIAGPTDTQSPDINVEDSTRMPLEDAQKIFLPIIIIFTVIAMALAVGYFIKAGKTKVAMKWMIIFIVIALVIFLIAMLVFYGVYGQL